MVICYQIKICCTTGSDQFTELCAYKKIIAVYDFNVAKKLRFVCQEKSYSKNMTFCIVQTMISTEPQAITR